MRGSHARLWLGGLAAAGMAAGHWLAYRLVADPHELDHLLESTGHRYFSLVAAAALGFFVAGLAGFAFRRVRSGGGGESPLGLFLAVVPRLLVVQVAGFAALEGAERVFVAGGGDAFFAEPAVVVGIALQVALAAVGAAFLVVLARAVDGIVRLLRRRGVRTRAARTVLVPASPLGVRRSQLAWAVVRRGPPAS